MAVPPGSIEYFQRRFGLFLLVLFCAFGKVEAENVLSLQLPLSRFSHGFTLHYLDQGGTEWTLPPNSSALTPAGSVDGNGNYILAAESNLELGFSFDEIPGQWWLTDDTTLELSVANTSDLRSAVWYITQPEGEPVESNVLSFAVAESRYSHVLNVVLESGNTYPVTQGSVVGENVLTEGGTAFQSFGFLNAWSYLDAPGVNFQMVDLTTREQAAPNETNLLGAVWSPLSLPGIVRSATVLVSGNDWNGAYTFHTSGGSLQGVSPWWASLYDSTSGSTFTGYFVSGSVGVGEHYWVTKANLISPEQQMLLGDQMVDWSNSFTAVRDVHSYSFQIGQNRLGHDFSIQHDDGYVTSFSTSWVSPSQLTTWNENGELITFYYGEFPGQVDTLQNWWLQDDTTGENLGQTTSIMEGWQPWNPSPPQGSVSLGISTSRTGHVLKLVQDDGATWVINRAAGYESPDAFLPFWPSREGRTNELYYFPAVGLYDPAQGFTVVDQTAGDQRYVPEGSSTDLSRWFPPASEFSVNISATRWTHDLWLHQVNGDSFLLSRGNVQGVWSQDEEGNGWFTSYGYFDAPTQYHPELGWWIYDATTGELSGDQPNDLSGWLSADYEHDSDGDGLPDWFEFISGSNPNAISAPTLNG